MPRLASVAGMGKEKELNQPSTMLFSKQTPAAGGTAFAQFDAAWCYDGNGYILNETGTSLDVRIGATGSVITLAAGGTLPIKLVYSMAELYVRRTDQSTTQVTVEAQVGTGSAGGGGSTADMADIAAASTAAHNDDAAAHGYGGALSQITGLLKQGSQSVSVLVCTDSTGVGSSNWVRLLASKLAAAAPAYNVRYRYFGSAVDGQNEVWYSVQQLYTAPGGRTHIVFDGSAQSSLPVYPATGAVGTAPFEIQIQVRFSTLAARQKLYCRANSALTNWQYLLEIVATGELIFRYNTADTGTLNADATSTAKLSTLLQAGEDAILKVSYSGTTTKQVTFAVSKDDGATWVQLGGAVTVTTGPSATANMQWFLGGPTHAFSGRIYGMEQTIGATKQVQLPDEIGKWTVTSGYGPGGTAVTNFSYAGAPTLTIWNGASGGQTYTYFTNAGGAGPQYFVNSGLDCVLMAALHNYSGALGTSFETYAASLPTYARTLCPAAYFVGMTQNPFSTVKDTLNRRYSRTKFSQQVGWCKKNGYPVIDIHSAFLANFTEERIAEITDSSGVHLIAGGEGPDFWAAQVASAF